MSQMLSNRKFMVAIVVASAIALVGCSSDDKKESSSSSTTQARTSTTEESSTASRTVDFDRIFAPISGYDLTELPSSVLSQARQQYQSEVEGNELASQAVMDLDGRAISQDGEGIAIVLGLEFDPQVSSLPGFHDGFIQGAAGDNPETVTLGGEDAALYTDDEGDEGIVWTRGQLALLVTSQSATSSELQDIMSQLIANA